MRSFLSFLLAILLLTCSICSCSKAPLADNVPCAELMDSAEDQIPVNFGYETYGSEHLRYYFEDTKLPDDVCLRYSVLSEDINEFGIFHAPSAEARDELKKLTETYLQSLRTDQRAFIESYAPEELPKLDRSEVKVMGNYVVYAILSDDERELVFETVEKKLREKQ